MWRWFTIRLSLSTLLATGVVSVAISCTFCTLPHLSVCHRVLWALCKPRLESCSTGCPSLHPHFSPSTPVRPKLWPLWCFWNKTTLSLSYKPLSGVPSSLGWSGSFLLSLAGKDASDQTGIPAPCRSISVDRDEGDGVQVRGTGWDFTCVLGPTWPPPPFGRGLFLGSLVLPATSCSVPWVFFWKFVRAGHVQWPQAGFVSEFAFWF